MTSLLGGLGMKGLRFGILIFAVSMAASGEVNFPDDVATPGATCSKDDPDFNKNDYPEKVARCRRNVSSGDKRRIADDYGSIPSERWREYEFDHLIPLCAGGSNSLKNVWPQPLEQAHSKDGLENDICLKMKAGALRQANAVKMIHQWFYENKSIWSKFGQDLVTAPVNCTSTNGIRVSFILKENKSISEVIVTVKGPDGEFEAIRRIDEISGKSVRAKSALLEGYIRFVINPPDSEDRLELFIPQGLASFTVTFDGFLKIAFEENYPKLLPLSCARHISRLLAQ